ncbi:methylenetetrahydrofolate reductase [Marinihelvus fidelis]|nr:methylenetetrahydrofolate reductase [Marinihelvus fidelis]
MPEIARYSHALQTKPFSICADLALDRHVGAGELRRQLAVLKPWVDAVGVPDAHDGRLQMSAQAAAVLALAEGIDPVVRLTGRDRNRIALENDLFGLGALGVESVVLTRGEALPPDYRPATRHVFELSGEDLVTTAHQLGEDDSVALGRPFCLGTAATVFAPKADWRPTALAARVDAGVRFIQTQPCFNYRVLKRWMAHLVEARLTWRCAVIVSLVIPHTVEAARQLRGQLPRALMSDRIENRMSAAPDPAAEAVALGAEKLAGLREIPGVSGVALTTPGPVELLARVIETAGVPVAGSRK